MALLNIFDIAGSALTAQSKRLNVAASNLANADSVTGPDGQPYRAKQVYFQVDAAPGAATGGVKVSQVVESQALQKAGYATDPNYARKLTSMIQQLKSMSEKVSHAYSASLDNLF
ncbi:flagellar basal body protein [Citrobacter rodentium]|uniref:Flagellar basal body rod protein FlgC n=1 Tax=Citrobacter rodentium TaxID=67825 RepID=A0A482PJ68_CITRO|nr:flagellar basal body rod protein FlgC [Citrobacter rodentium]HAT8012979.1 flagellar basal body rod protein FlgC [Citrobacter rodentium NBRC 105723 = DSM 16636]HAT8019023.1 flagellar basal body rod protein FlgC [Citrobacter rodentium]HAT8028246.1 flagellar basal body rod protein FlgC [Citrobacter rodentium]HAT8032923.1 flagellar basal body rod protein FlgC [Citrobacter rodentium]